VPCDKLVLLSRRIRSRFLKLAEQHGRETGGYSSFTDLRETEVGLPVRLYCGGFYNGVNKIQLDREVAHLGLKRTQEIVQAICGDDPFIRISRIDWCLDLAGLSVTDFALYTRLERAQNFSLHKSREGATFYLRFSKHHKVLVYDRLARLRMTRSPLVQFYKPSDRLTRLEIQLQGRGVPIRNFREIDRFGKDSLLRGLSFWKLASKRKGLTNVESLAAEGLLHKIEAYGLQGAAKMYTSQAWAYLSKKLLMPMPETSFPNLDRLMRKSIRDWLDNRVRFPRLEKG
jgi:hypothetical protein